MYRVYTLDKFCILNFAIVLWMYGMLNKIKNEMKNENEIYYKHLKSCCLAQILQTHYRTRIPVKAESFTLNITRINTDFMNTVLILDVPINPQKV